jgi:hypothetical protein
LKVPASTIVSNSACFADPSEARWSVRIELNRVLLAVLRADAVEFLEILLRRRR